MANRRLISEWMARLVIALFVLGVPALMVFSKPDGIVIRASMPKEGGWQPGNLTVSAGEPVTLRLTSEDVVHGFAVGKMGWPAVDVKPGIVHELTLTFDQPGVYTYYCTRWCGPNHWRMRGMIEVTGSIGESHPVTPPLYQVLGLDIDAPHQIPSFPVQKPSASRGADLAAYLPEETLSQEYYQRTSPYDTWQELREDPKNSSLSDGDIWELVAFIWGTNTSVEALKTGTQLYAQNCAACHGEGGRGNGVMAKGFIANNIQFSPPSQGFQKPADFTDPALMLGASPALLQGKILRGGMGTGMPAWGSILTDEETWFLVDYLWTFQFFYEKE